MNRANPSTQPDLSDEALRQLLEGADERFAPTAPSEHAVQSLSGTELRHRAARRVRHRRTATAAMLSVTSISIATLVIQDRVQDRIQDRTNATPNHTTPTDSSPLIATTQDPASFPTNIPAGRTADLSPDRSATTTPRTLAERTAHLARIDAELEVATTVLAQLRAEVLQQQTIALTDQTLASTPRPSLSRNAERVGNAQLVLSLIALDPDITSERDAESRYRLLIERFPETPAAAIARQRLEDLKPMGVIRPAFDLLEREHLERQNFARNLPPHTESPHESSSS